MPGLVAAFDVDGGDPVQAIRWISKRLFSDALPRTKSPDSQRRRGVRGARPRRRHLPRRHPGGNDLAPIRQLLEKVADAGNNKQVTRHEAATTVELLQILIQTEDDMVLEQNPVLFLALIAVLEDLMTPAEQAMLID